MREYNGKWFSIRSFFHRWFLADLPFSDVGMDGPRKLRREERGMSDLTETVARILAQEQGPPNYGEDDWAIWVPQANRVISAVSASNTLIEEQAARIAELQDKVIRVEKDRDERWAQAESIQAALNEVKPVLDWASRQQRKPFGVTKALDSFSSKANQ